MNDIAVIVPVYNGEKDIEKCLFSLLNQTIAVKIIVVDDGSNDQTGAIVKRMAANQPERIFYYYKENSGIADARMSGFWEPDAAVTATDEAVKVTAYERKGRVLLSIGNYSDTLKHVRLHIDRKRLCLKGKNYRLRAPEIPTFQAAGEWGMEEEIPVEPRKGWLLLLEEEK